MASLLTGMRSALEGVPTSKSTKNICSPTWLVLESLLAAQTRLLREIWATWTATVLKVAIVRDLRMTAILRATAEESTKWRLSPTRQRCL